MSKLFNVEVNTINYHLKEIFEANELEENRTIRKIRTVQNEGSRSVNEFLEFRKYDILKDNGKISRKMAEEKAEKEYDEFNKTQKITSDFDKLLIEAKKLKNK